MDSLKHDLHQWDFGYGQYPQSAPFDSTSAQLPSSLSHFDAERTYVIDDAMVTSESSLRQRSVLYNAPLDYNPFPSYYPTDDPVLPNYQPMGVTFDQVPMEMDMDMDLDADYNSVESDTSSAANSPRESLSLAQIAHTESANDLTPREDADGNAASNSQLHQALFLAAAEKIKSKRSKGHGLYRCPLASCQRTYRRKGDLKVHCKKKHPDHLELPDLISKPRSTRSGKAFLCPEPGCPCGFMRQRGLIRHYRKKHPEKAVDPLSFMYFDDAGVMSGDSEDASRPTRMSERMRSIRAALGRSFSSGSEDNGVVPGDLFSGEEDEDDVYEESL